MPSYSFTVIQHKIIVWSPQTLYHESMWPVGPPPTN